MVEGDPPAVGFSNGNGTVQMNGNGASFDGPAVIDVSPVHEDAPSAKHARDSPPPAYNDVDGTKEQENGGSVEGEGGEKEEKKETKVVGTFEVFRFATGLDVVFILLALVISLCHGVALPAVLLLFGEVTDSFITTASVNVTDNLAAFEESVDSIITFSIYYSYLGCGVLALAYFQVVLWDVAAERQIHKVRLRFFHAILRQEIAWFDVHKGGELNTRLADDIDKIRNGIGDKLGIMLQYTATFVAGITIGFVKSWKLTLVILAVSLILIVPLVGSTSVIIQRMTKQALDAYAKAGAIAGEVFSGIRTVVAFNGEEKEMVRYSSNLDQAKSKTVKKDFATLLAQGFLFFSMFSSYAIAFWYGTVLYLDNEITPGDILTTFLAVLFGAFAIGQAGPNYSDFTTARAAASSIWEVIDQIPTIDCFSTDGKKEKITGQVTFEGVHFSYPSRASVKVLNGINLKVDVGKTVAMVGSSGCGKSTCIQLIQRFYDVAEGSIKIDGIDIRDLNVSWLRDHIGVVSQEPILFATTIEENIRYGRLDVTQVEIEKAAEEANAHEFISKLPEGYSTLVGERGAQLSGGQKQRIAIARALVRNPTILLLDEATSALDTESEATVQLALEKAQHGRTTLVIAHRLSTIFNSDLICAFKEGIISEQGTHEELMKNEGGVYHTLVMKQGMKKEEEEEKKENEVPLDDDDDEEDDSQGEKVYRAGSGKKKLTRVLSRTQSQMSGDEEKQDEDEYEKELEKHFSMMRVWKLNTPECGFILLGCIGAAINGAVQPGFAVVFSKILGAYSITDRAALFDEVTIYCVLFAALGLLSLLASIIQGVGFGKSGGELTLRLRNMMFRAILRQNISFFDDKRNGTGALTTKLATDVSLIQGVTGVRLGMIFEVLFNIGVGIVISFVYSWQIACLLLFAFLPILSLAGMIGWKILQGNSIGTAGSQAEVGKLVSECIENIRTVQSLNRGQTFHLKYCELQNPPYKQGIKGAFAAGLAFGFSQATIFFAYSATFRLGAHLVGTGDLTFPDVFLSFSALMFGAFGLGRAAGSVPDFSKAKVATGELFYLVDRSPDIDTFSDDGEKPASYGGSVSLNNVRFRYPTRPDVPVLRGLSVSVDPGETLALVGSSGCGKSTTIQLMERFYDPHSGTVMFDSHDASLLNTRWQRAQVGLVSQEPCLFDMSIAENIKYGDNSREVSIEDCIEAAKKSNIHDFVDSLPMKYDTNVGSKGTQLSGGQKQRIAIARALVRNPKVLLLDEATSALDTESERVVQDALDEAKKGRTCITIAHRLSTIHNAEKIAVIREGKLAEFGKHEELMAMKQQYYSLYTAQSMQH
ncbi:egg permeability glycoprotein [Strongylocentrotus purpuratus]|uniref:Egg permeability glycoprotein n=1 Tax=Strongylocentrotus purpuratus TaxID=7668 RepID=Q3T7C8_STRPU|nr:egg permeability glycoprotein [Strongylocentrotus purpuratus]AAW28777.1 egg permeability glycoprotein [Strongylocentrotus purpuratus]|eukprot:NP_001029122.1 egg permeability glycoprotein [Strongylocentrotus purpuratus]